MRERHFPRVCHSCQAPMARQEDTCWRCGARWASEAAPRTTLQVVAGGVPTHAARAADRRIAIALADNALRATELRQDADRWFDDGASVAAETVAPLVAVAGRR